MVGKADGTFRGLCLRDCDAFAAHVGGDGQSAPLSAAAATTRTTSARWSQRRGHGGADAAPAPQTWSELGDAHQAVDIGKYMRRPPPPAARPRPLSFDGLPTGPHDFDASNFYTSVVGANAENVIGFVPLPVGAVGPLIVDGRSLPAVPLATTEGALIASTNRGATAVSKAGGVSTVVTNDGMTRAPLIRCTDLQQAAAMKAYCESEEGLAELQSIFSTTSRFGQLLNVKVSYAGRNAYPRFKCATGDAMG